jgi:hypothetical protein
MRSHLAVTLFAMAFVLVWLMGIHVWKALEDAKPTVMTYQELQRIL